MDSQISQQAENEQKMNRVATAPEKWINGWISQAARLNEAHKI